MTMIIIVIISHVIFTTFNAKQQKKIFTVKLRYNGLTYNISSVIEYASSRSRHFSMQNVLLITYLDIMYPRLLQTNYWAQTLQQTPASMYIRPPSCHLCSWLQWIMCRQSAWHFNAVGMSPSVRSGVLIAANAGHIPLLRWFTRAGVDQSAFQLWAIKETISSFDYTVWFERRY